MKCIYSAIFYILFIYLYLFIYFIDMCVCVFLKKLKQKILSVVMCQSHFAGNKFVRVRFFLFLFFAWDLINEPKTSPL